MAKKCTWRAHPGWESLEKTPWWKPGCGHKADEQWTKGFVLFMPLRMRYCPYCGDPIKIGKPKPVMEVMTDLRAACKTRSDPEISDYGDGFLDGWKKRDSYG